MITAAARLGTRIPRAPPLHRERHDQHRDHGGMVREIGQQRQLVLDLRIGDEPGKSADARLGHGIIGRRDRADHGQHEQKQIGDHHAPQPGGGGVNHGDQRGEHDRGVGVEAEQHARDLDRGERDRGHDHHVEEHAEIDGAEAAQEGGRRAGIAQLVEIDVGQRARPAPQLGVEEHGHHAGDEKGPPQPIHADAAGAHQIGHEIGRVGGKGGRHHRGAEQPPRQLAAGQEILLEAAARPLGEHQTDDERDRAVDRHHNPIDPLKLHGGSASRVRTARVCNGPRSSR